MTAMTRARKSEIEQAFAVEAESGQTARALADLPTSYDRIAPEWWTAMLCRDHPAAVVTGFRAVAPDTLNRGHMRVHLEYNAAGRAAGLPSSVFCKDSQSLGVRLLNAQCDTVSGEILFYNHIRSLVDVKTPRALHSAYDNATHNSIIVMEDLDLEGAEFCLPETRLSRAQAESQMAVLARLHGQFFGRTGDHPLVAGLENFRNTALRYDASLDLASVTHKGFLGSAHVIPERLYQRDAEIWPATLAALEIHEQAPVTLGHNDAHIKNWFITGSGEPGLADWQALRRAHWSHDVTFALATSLTVDDRRAWEQDLLGYYADRLQAAGGPRLVWDEIWTAYRRSLLIALSWWTCCVRHDHSFEYHPMDDTFAVIGRVATAIDDLDALAAFAGDD